MNAPQGLLFEVCKCHQYLLQNWIRLCQALMSERLFCKFFAALHAPNVICIRQMWLWGCLFEFLQACAMFQSQSQSVRVRATFPFAARHWCSLCCHGHAPWWKVVPHFSEIKWTETSKLKSEAMSNWLLHAISSGSAWGSLHSHSFYNHLLLFFFLFSQLKIVSTANSSS